MKPFMKLLTKYVPVIASLLLLGSLAPAKGTPKKKESPKRARIFGIAYVEISASDLPKSREFYSLLFRSATAVASSDPCNWCEPAPGAPFGQVVLLKLQSPHETDLLAEIALRTDNAATLRDFLKKNNIPVEKLTKCGGDPCFAALDPEKHSLVFVQGPGLASSGIWTGLPGGQSSSRPSVPIIHAGLVVHDRAAEDHFYKDLLGFHPYWHGGMKDDKDDWVAMQVPDGVDWLEYMLNIPSDASHHTLGVMNHISLGVTDIHAIQKQLIANGWQPKEELKIGRDGKWQLNLYDPDDTRIEFMEFKPAEKPCCSDFTGTHPGPQN
jgi:catechol 2,3-dioxygenase-like lactoylglutathione lyase family enzyme